MTDIEQTKFDIYTELADDAEAVGKSVGSLIGSLWREYADALRKRALAIRQTSEQKAIGRGKWGPGATKGD